MINVSVDEEALVVNERHMSAEAANVGVEGQHVPASMAIEKY